MHDSANYFVIFVSQRTAGEDKEYAAMAARMEELARGQDGFVGIHSVRDSSGRGITVSYWTSLRAIANWRGHIEHLEAQRLGRSKWYEAYEIAVAKIERLLEFGHFNP